jgi:hypothetical protein
MGGLMADRPKDKSTAITEEELKGLLAVEIRSAETDSDDLHEKRTKAEEYYRGEMTDTPAMVNRSSVVSRDVADTLGWMIPGIIRVFTASDRMAEYEPVRPGDEAFAKQATDYINHVFWKDNPGYRILWWGTHDSLLKGNGIVKHWWDKTEECEYDEFTGLTIEQLSLLVMDGCEIVGQKAGEPQMVPGDDGQPIEVQTFDVKTKRVVKTGTLRVECIEPENFLIDKQARSIDEARFCAHRDEKTRSELIEMGFDREAVEALPADARSSLSEEALARDEENGWLKDVGHDSTRLIEIFECYVKADADGDGIAETIRAYYAGKAGAGELLDWEVWEDDVPFSDIPCEPVPHRWDARSVADETMDVQRIKTVLSRQMLDNLYASNMPMQEAETGSITNPEMLLAPKFGGIIWRKKGMVGPAVTPLAVPFVADKVLTALQHFDNVIEKRTGVSRATMALDPETLQNQTATANQNQRDAAYSQIELIARNQAELGWRRVFRQMLKLIVKHQDRPRMIRLRDKWEEMDPRAWNAGMDVTINVGLGTGSRDRDAMMLGNIMGVQEKITAGFAQAGATSHAIDMIPKIVLSATKLAESTGLKNPDQYFPTITPEEIEQLKKAASEPQPNPKIEEIKATGEVQAQLKQVDAQVSMHDAQLKAQGEVAKNTAELQADLQTKEADRQNALAIEAAKQASERERQQLEMLQRREELDREYAFKMWDAEQSRQLEREKMANAQTIAAMKPKPQPGKTAN